MNNNGIVIKPLRHYVRGEKSIGCGSTTFLSATEFRDKSAKQRYIRPAKLRPLISTLRHLNLGIANVDVTSVGVASPSPKAEFELFELHTSDSKTVKFVLRTARFHF
jgi:hypothetical protein